MKKALQEVVKAYIINNGKPDGFSWETLNERFKISAQKYFDKIQETVKKDHEAASLGLPTKKPTQLQESAAKISLVHGLTMYAKYLVTGIETIDEIK